MERYFREGESSKELDGLHQRKVSLKIRGDINLCLESGKLLLPSTDLTSMSPAINVTG